VPNDVLARAPIFLPWQNNFPVRRKIILSAVKKSLLVCVIQPTGAMSFCSIMNCEGCD
jgi:hypothetical protein